MIKKFELNSVDEIKIILGERDKNLKIFNEKFECKIISRGNFIEVHGDDSEVNKFTVLLNELLKIYRGGNNITVNDVNSAIKLIKNNSFDELKKILSETLIVTANGTHIHAKTVGQKIYINSMKKNIITFGIGSAGTGKTFLAVAMAAYFLRIREVKKIILTRPAVEAGEKLGFLPGDLQDKVNPYFRPIYDSLQEILGFDTYQKFFSRGIIEIAPLAYMRGRTLNNSFIILDEAQNTTSRQMKMFLTRLGFGSRMVITGDLSQIDLNENIKSGLAQAVKILKNIEGIGISELTANDVVRHDIVSKIINAYESFGGF